MSDILYYEQHSSYKDTVHHQGLRLSLGAFRTSPVESVYAEANRRIKLGIQYATKLKAFPSNPGYNYVCNPLYENVSINNPNTIQHFGHRVKSHFENSDINLDDKAPIVFPENPPWVNPKPILILGLQNTKNLKQTF